MSTRQTVFCPCGFAFSFMVCGKLAVPVKVSAGVFFFSSISTSDLQVVIFAYDWIHDIVMVLLG